MNDYLPQNNSVDTELTENSRLGYFSYKMVSGKMVGDETAEDASESN